MEILNIEYANFVDLHPVSVLLLILITGIFLSFGIILLIEENKIIRVILLIIISIACLCGLTFLLLANGLRILQIIKGILKNVEMR